MSRLWRRYEEEWISLQSLWIRFRLEAAVKAFCCWSGGKESALSYYRVLKEQKIKIGCLLNMIDEFSEHSRTHGISSTLLQAQVKAIGSSLTQQKTTWKSYEIEFKKAVAEFKNGGIEAGVFGDIDLQEHRDWAERVCEDMGIRPILPLWKEKREELLKQFIQAGFKAIVVAINVDFLGKDWLGREINKELIEELKAMERIDLCGEKGEYHTFVYDGPIFKKPVKFNLGEKVLQDKHWFLRLA
ncbi:MAG: diphthine--ammonia ligase [Candidatus Omnitrophica bacterium]|nr:diphthine--ammonia ligase [Candidatus Omnitrophota bacterium]MBU1810862.1 diphthine--ammonia ligase [Candidatus Omnitrophota bacterium]